MLSLRQLALATDMDDPVLASKCKIFAAYSLLQRGKLKAASKIIRLGTHTHTLVYIPHNAFTFLLLFLEAMT